MLRDLTVCYVILGVLRADVLSICLVGHAAHLQGKGKTTVHRKERQAGGGGGEE